MEWSVDIEGSIGEPGVAQAALDRLTAALDDEGGSLTEVGPGALRATLLVNAVAEGTAAAVATRIWERSLRVAGIAGGAVTHVAVSTPEGTPRP